MKDHMNLKEQAIHELHKVTYLPKPEIEKLLEVPPNPKMGDLSFPCFILAKQFKKAPGQIAREFREKLVVPKGFKKVEIAGPYLNFYYNSADFAEQVLKEAKKKDFGRLNQKHTFMLDVYQANPYKSFHIGHVRNAVLGESIRRILEFAGNKTIAASFSGDIGIHVARWLVYYQTKYSGKVPKDNFTKWVGEIYSTASQLGKTDKNFEEESHELNRALHNNEPKITKLWDKFRKMCYHDYEKIAKELGCKIDIWIPESDCIEPGIKKVNNLIKSKKLIKSEGAWGLDLKKYDLGFFLLLKSDGTSLYSTKDFGNLYIKNAFNNKYDKSLYVVASEQEFYFNQLFKAYDVLNMSPGVEHIHLNYGYVNLKSGKMSSRLGNVILYEDLRDNMSKIALSEVSKRQKSLSKSKLNSIANAIAFGAIKYDLLKYSVRTPIGFDMNDALSFEGNTGPYLQYALVRASKIMKKSRQSITTSVDFSLLNSKEEQNLVKHIENFPEIIEQAVAQFSPQIIANYAYELAQKFSTFYAKHRVVGATIKEEKARLLLVHTFYETLKKALTLLGMDEVEVM